MHIGRMGSYRETYSSQMGISDHKIPLRRVDGTRDEMIIVSVRYMITYNGKLYVDFVLPKDYDSIRCRAMSMINEGVYMYYQPLSYDYSSLSETMVEISRSDCKTMEENFKMRKRMDKIQPSEYSYSMYEFITMHDAKMKLDDNHKDFEKRNVHSIVSSIMKQVREKMM